MAWEKIKAEEISGNLFERIGKQWFLLTAGSEGKWNTMTCSWGMAGVLWNQPSVTCYVRKSRYTSEFMESQDVFTLSFLPEQYRKALAFCGSHSGREFDKAAQTGLQPKSLAGGVSFEEAELVLVCKKRFSADIDVSQLPADIAKSYYSGDALHRMYIGEIVSVYRNI